MNKIVLIGGICVVLLTACGQKGPLYLPQPAKPSADAPKTAPAKPESKTNSN